MTFQSWCSMSPLPWVVLQELSWTPTLCSGSPSDNRRNKLVSCRVVPVTATTRQLTQPVRQGQGTSHAHTFPSRDGDAAPRGGPRLRPRLLASARLVLRQT